MRLDTRLLNIISLLTNVQGGGGADFLEDFTNLLGPGGPYGVDHCV